MTRVISSILIIIILLTASGCQNTQVLNTAVSTNRMDNNSTTDKLVSPTAQVSISTKNVTQQYKDQKVVGFAEELAKKQYTTLANNFQKGIVLASEDKWYLIKIGCTWKYDNSSKDIYIILIASQFVYDIDGNLSADIKYNKDAIIVLQSGSDIFQTTFIPSSGWSSFADSCRRTLPVTGSTTKPSTSDSNSDIQPCPVKSIYDTYQRNDYVDSGIFSMYVNNYLKKNSTNFSWQYFGTTKGEINPNPYGFDGYDVFRVVYPGTGESWYLVPYSKQVAIPVVYYYDSVKNQIQRVWLGKP